MAPSSFSPLKVLVTTLLALAAISPAAGCGYHKSKRYLAARAEFDASAIGPKPLARRQRKGDPLATLRILNPYANIFAYYDGRTGDRFFSQEPNWLDDGAFTLGVASYSIIDGEEALLYDAHITNDHAKAMIQHVQSLGVTKMTLVYSHFHNDHIAGGEVFAAAGAKIVGQTITLSTVKKNTKFLATDAPPIKATLPTDTYENTTTITLGGPNKTAIELHHFNIHTPDGTVLFMPKEKLLFAGDTLEDSATFIADPANFKKHISELDRMFGTFPADTVRILPAHGSPDTIAKGGYTSKFINATSNYIKRVNEPVETPVAWTQKLEQVIAPEVAEGTLIYFAQYEAVHASNIEGIQRVRKEVKEATAKTKKSTKKDKIKTRGMNSYGSYNASGGTSASAKSSSAPSGPRVWMEDLVWPVISMVMPLVVRMM